MPRNSSGTFSLAQPAYVAGTTITSAAMNSNLSDIASGLTTSLATTGVSSMSGPIKIAAGTLAAPSITLASDLTTGFYNSAAGSFTFVASGSAVATLSPTGLAVTNLSVVGTITITGAISAAAATFISAVVPLTLKNSTNDALEHTFASLGLGSGAGDTYGITGLGTGANDVTQVRHYIGATEIYRFTATTLKSQIDFEVGASIHLDSAGYAGLTEIAAPGAGAANVGRLYAVDVTGTTILAYVDSAGLVTNLRGATQTEQETGTATNIWVTPGVQKFNTLHPKAWLLYNLATDAIIDSVGITSAVRGITGVFVVTLTTAFKDANSYSVTGFARGAGGDNEAILTAATAGTKTASTIQLQISNSVGTLRNSTEVFVAFFGKYT